MLNPVGVFLLWTGRQGLRYKVSLEWPQAQGPGLFDAAEFDRLTNSLVTDRLIHSFMYSLLQLQAPTLLDHMPHMLSLHI